MPRALGWLGLGRNGWRTLLVALLCFGAVFLASAAPAGADTALSTVSCVGDNLVISTRGAQNSFGSYQLFGNGPNLPATYDQAGTVTVTGPGAWTNLTVQQDNGVGFTLRDTIGSATCPSPDTTAQTITFAAPADRTYGAAPFQASATGGASGNPVTFTSSTTAVCTATGTNGATITIVGAGTCTLTANQAGSGSYTAADPVTRSFNVAKATLTVTADNKSRQYGAANPTLTASISGFVNGEALATSGVTGAPSLSTTATASSPVSGSPYAITVSNGTLASGNYTFTFVNGTLTVTKASLTVTVANASKVFSAPNPTFAATFAGFVNGDTAAAVSGSAAFATAATQYSPVGNYQVSATQGSLSAANYDFGPFVAGTLTITQAATALFDVRGETTYGDTSGSVTATLYRTQGDYGPVVGARVRFFINGVAVCGGGGQPACPLTNAQGVATLTGVATPAGLQGGSYPTAVQARFDGDTNHLAADTSGPLTVARRILWVKPQDQQVVLGQPNPTTCTLVLTNGSQFAPGDGWASINTKNLRCVYSRNYPYSTPGETVGTKYKISAIGAVSANYDVRYQIGTLTVVAATP